MNDKEGKDSLLGSARHPVQLDALFAYSPAISILKADRMAAACCQESQ
jgi:hypothetical protein